jgi:two-component system, chemotaxis family, chemotaxis protein CheY
MHVLVIDDSRATRMILRRLMTSLGFEVVEAGDGQEALDRLAEVGAVDLALVDWNMPVMSGLEFVKALRADHAYDACKVVMVTTESDVERVVEALEAGANEYAMKPFDRDVITGKLAMVGIHAEAL